MDLTQYILQGLSILPKKTAVINSQTVQVLFNQSSHRDNKVLGGYEPDNSVTIYVETSLITNPKSLKGVSITIDDEPFRIVLVRYGQYVTHFECISVDAQ